MDYFIENGMNSKIASEIYNNLSENDLALIEHNRKNVTEIYNYFKKIGLSENSLLELFLTDIDIFFRDIDDIKSNIEKYDISKVVILLNKDISSIYQVI